VAQEGDPYVALADAAIQSLSQAGVFGAYLIDYIPLLRYVPSWMPGASFKRKARKWRRLSHEMRESQFKIVKEKMVSRAIVYTVSFSKDLQAKGTAVACIATSELERCVESGRSDEEELAMNIPAIAYGGESILI
jgi:hypothetical protein